MIECFDVKQRDFVTALVTFFADFPPFLRERWWEGGKPWYKRQQLHTVQSKHAPQKQVLLETTVFV